MIDARELRIGNWVAMGVHHCTVNSIHTVPQTGESFFCIAGFVERNDQHQIYNYQVDPIPLTPEVLEKCGFMKRVLDGMDVWEKQMLSDPVSVLQWYDDGSISIEHSEEGGLVAIQAKALSLHSLMNLLHSLTGTELDYKP